MISLYNEKNEKLKSLSVYEVSEADMGESSISATVSFSEPQDFHPDWYVEYNGEKYRLGVRKPTGKKDTSSLQTTYTLVFKSEREDLKRYTFMDFVELGTGNPQPNSYNVPLYATLSEFVSRFNTNLDFYMKGWRMVLPADYVEEGNAVTMSFDNATLWDVLIQVYDTFGVRWSIEGKTIKVAFPAVELEHIFEYGKGNGLVSVERNNALERIITRLRGRGGEKNLPPDYFHSGDPDTNNYLKASFFKNLMPKAYRDYARGYNAGSGTGSWAYNQGVADKKAGRPISPVDYAISDKEDLWGVSYGAIEPAEGIFPTLQGATRNGVRLDEVLDVEQVLVDGPREPIATTPIGIGTGGYEVSVGTCGTRPTYMSDCRNGVDFTILTEKFVVSNAANKVQVRLTAAPSFVNDEGLSEYVAYGADTTVRLTAVMELISGSKVIRSYTVKDTDTFLWELSDVPVNSDYRIRTRVTWSANIVRSEVDPTKNDVVVSIDTRLTGATVYEYERPEDKNEFKTTFDVEIRDVWGISRNEGESDADYTYRVWSPRAVSQEMAVMFSDGLLAGEDYEFRIVGFSSDSDNLYQVITSAVKPTKNGWKLTLEKSDSEVEASGRYLPNTMQNAKAGDHLFFINISMPYDPYVYDAEQRVQDYLDTQLALKDEEFPSFTITPSKIFCASFAEVSKLRAGSKVRVSNTALIGDTDISLHIQSITKRYTAESLNPEWSITISDQVVASGNPVSILEGNVAILNQKVYSNKEAVKEAIKAMGSTFLRRDGVAADSISPTEFKKKVKLGKEGISDTGFVNGDISGRGFGVYTDSDGNRVIEADILVGRIGARFNEVKINQVTYSAGKQVFSSAGMVVSAVADNGNSWRCYFDTENGTKRNYFAVNDGAFSQRFTDAGIRQYWQRVVAIGADYIDITKGGMEPLVGDNIAQLGNSTDKSRQAALMIDETRDGGGLVTWYDDITGFTLNGKDSVNIGRIEGKTWLQVYGAGYIGDREGSQYVKYEDGKVTIKGKLEVGTTLSDGRELEQAIADAAPEGYDEFVEQVTKEFENIRNEMDGAIDTWFGEETPTLSNYPAVDWVTNADKDSHLGDLFYTNDGKAYRFQYTQGEGYYWAVIEDSEVVKALELAQKALDTADGKRRVFIETPFPPYDLGDLWAGGSEQPLKRCINAKGENGSYVADDWALADDSHAYADAVREELQGSISDTTDALNTAISDAQKAANTYTDDAKTAIQNTITALEKAKANVDDVYTKSQADEEISRAEQDAIKAAQEAADAAIVLANETVKAYADGIVTAEEEARIKQAKENLEAANKYAEEKAQEAFNNASDLIAGYAYLREALKEDTTIDGGLIQSALLMLGYTTNGVFKVMSGTNGIYKANEKGGGIAAWYGGPMADKEANSSLVEYAQSLFRFDGSGYLAGGNITWDKDGAGHVAGGDLSWDKNGVITLGSSIRISGDTNETLSSILAFINEYRNLWTYDATNNAVRTALNLIVDEAISFGGVGSGGSGGGGVTALSALTDVALGTLVDGQALVWDATQLKWVNKNVSGGLAKVTVKLGTVSYTSDGGVVSLPAYPSALSQLNNDAGYIKPNAAGNVLINAPLDNGNKLQVYDASFGDLIYLQSNDTYAAALYQAKSGAIWAVGADYQNKFYWYNGTKSAVVAEIDTDGVFKASGARFNNNVGIGKSAATAYSLDILNTANGNVAKFASNDTFACAMFLPSTGNQWSIGANNDNNFYFYSKNKEKIVAHFEEDGALYATSVYANDKVLLTAETAASTYLPLSGGALNGDNNILTINGINNSYILFNLNKSARVSVGYYNNFACIANEIGGYARIGIADNGEPQYWTDYTGNTKYTLIHSGNIADQKVNRAKYIETLEKGGTYWYGDNYRIYGQWGSDNSSICDWKVDSHEVRVDRARKLNTARSLWGKTFDGSGDISGGIYLYGVGYFNAYNALGNKGNAAIVINKGGDYFGMGASAANLSNFAFGTTSDSNGTWKKECIIFTNDGRLFVNSTSGVDGAQLYVAGNIYASGAITFGSSASDMRLKDVTSRDYDAVSILRGLSTFKYRWNSTAKGLTDNFANDNDEHFGLSAQELQKVSNYLVSNFDYGSGNKYLVLRKEELVPLLVQAVKQLLDRIERLENNGSKQ